MANISKINLNNTTYDLKDAQARIDLTNKQDTLVSGTNIKTINGESLLGSGDVEVAYTAIYGETTYADLITALSGDKAVIIKDVPYNGDYLTVLVNWWNDTGTAVEIESITTAQGDLCDASVTVTSENMWTSAFVSRDPFMLLDFQQQINATIPSVTVDISNTSIPNVDVSISEELGANWAIASLAKYEVWDATSGGNRLNVMPICMFSMNTQKTLRLRMMAAGPNSKNARRISGAILLKHR